MIKILKPLDQPMCKKLLQQAELALNNKKEKGCKIKKNETISVFKTWMENLFQFGDKYAYQNIELALVWNYSCKEFWQAYIGVTKSRNFKVCDKTFLLY